MTGSPMCSHVLVVVTACALTAIALVGCAAPPPATPDEYDRGVVWLFPGVEGGAWQMKTPARALCDAGVDLAFEVHDWWKPFGSVVNLTDLESNRRAAAGIARRIGDYRASHPAQPVHLVGYSGGGGLALLVVEALPPGVYVENVVLVQAAISPGYDLTRALQHLSGRIVNLYCPSDRLTLGAGTTLMGTIDRQYGPAAGKVGFDLPRAVRDPAWRARVVQESWGPEARRTGHLGGHLGILGYEWNRAFVAPWCLE